MTTTYANNAVVTYLSTHRDETVGRFRRTVALFALAAWTLSAVACPVSDHEMDVDQTRDESQELGGQVYQHDDSPTHPAIDLCCELLSGVHAIAQPIATTTPDKAPVASFAAANAPAATFVLEVDPDLRLVPHANGPPRSLYQRFATFWSHAPPASHV